MVTILTGHEGAHKKEEIIDWSLLARLGGTIVIMMGMSNLDKNMQRLLDGGIDPATPVAVIEKGSTPEQRMVSADVTSIAQRCKGLGIGAPAVVVVGSVVSLWRTLGDLS
jgi:uroporphyrin-III C-methyltransferase